METALSTYRVLIVDDNEGIHDDFRSLLQPKRGPDELDALAGEIFGEQVAADEPVAELPNYRCDSAFQGPAALENVKDAVANGESYALAFVDIRMPPGWDGVETILHLWAIDPNIQMVLCSAYSDYSWEEIVQKLGVSDKLLMLRKPFDPNSVKQLTLATTHRWHRDRLVRQRLAELEARLERCEKDLLALGAGGVREPDAPADVQGTLDELMRTLDQLAAESPAEHVDAIARVREIAASLEATLRLEGAHR